MIFASCKKKETLNISITSIEIDSEEETFNFNISSDGEWNITCDASWCDFSKKAGIYDEQITVTCKTNFELLDRTTTIVINGKDESKTLYVKQKYNQIINNDTKCYITKISINNQDYMIFEYDINNLLIKKSHPPSGNYWNYNYNSDNKVVKRVRYADGIILMGADSTLYEYDSNNNLSKSTDYMLGVISWSNYFYDKKNNLIKSEHYANESWIHKEIVNISYWEYEYDDYGNIIRDSRYMVDENGVFTKRLEKKITYSNFNNPFKNLSFPQTDELISPNNILTLTEVRDIIFSDTTLYNYEYNEFGYPIKRIDETGENIIYEYKNVLK